MPCALGCRSTVRVRSSTPSSRRSRPVRHRSGRAGALKDCDHRAQSPAVARRWIGLSPKWLIQRALRTEADERLRSGPGTSRELRTDPDMPTRRTSARDFRLNTGMTLASLPVASVERRPPVDRHGLASRPRGSTPGHPTLRSHTGGALHGDSSVEGFADNRREHTAYPEAFDSTVRCGQPPTQDGSDVVAVPDPDLRSRAASMSDGKDVVLR